MGIDVDEFVTGGTSRCPAPCQNPRQRETGRIQESRRSPIRNPQEPP